MTDLPQPIPAATLILMRAVEAGGPPELLMMERAETMAFAAGALVFPGGRIDPGDHETAQFVDEAPEDAAARIAAIRETIEETGVAPAIRPAPDAAFTDELRRSLADGEAFAPLLARLGLALSLNDLTPFARWCPNFRETRRFDAIFYLAEAPPVANRATADETEAARAFWATARDILAELDSGRARAIFPTRRNLERLALFGSIEEARADAALHPVRQITPWVEEREGTRWVCIPEGIGYPVTAERLETARRR